MTPRAKDLVIVIDQSSYMGQHYDGHALLDYARKAAKAVVDTMQIRDRVRSAYYILCLFFKV